jgi:hypothetical protein
LPIYPKLPNPTRANQKMVPKIGKHKNHYIQKT